MLKTHTCGELRSDHAGQTVTLAGWVNRRRDHGGLTFIDLRDRFGIVQIVTDPKNFPDIHTAFEPVRNEWVLQIVGEVRRRPSDMANSDLATGEIEVAVSQLKVLNPAKTPPFSINTNEEVDENVRLKYRYLDLRRERMQFNIEMRYRVIKFIRDYLDGEGFLEIETPILFKATPEGARDYLVPSRVHPGEFYALPQSPQQLKQLLMVAGMERYFQIARCFRDEDQRGDRQPEFTQLDMEISFVERDDVMAVLEAMYTQMSEKLQPGKRIMQTPWPRLTYQEAINRFGTDAPDMRFGMELEDISDLAAESGFKVFSGAIEAGGQVKGINAKGLGGYSRKQLDVLTEFVKPFGAKGLAYLAITPEGEERSSFAKFLNENVSEQIKQRLSAEKGDLLLFVADKAEVVAESLARLRVHLGGELGLRDPKVLAFTWIIDFPLVFWNESEKRWDPSHHLFTSPLPEDIGKIETDPGSVRGAQYDAVLNGSEVAGGSIRIHDRTVQSKIFKLIGLDEKVAAERFGHMLEAFEYGAPPHGGIASGLDRLAMIFAEAPNIREVIAFPKNQAARDVMADAPAPADSEQLKELHIKLDLPKAKK
ncbi:MAG: aspartate--tRNA ligase [Chloroflexi bacterium]|nr:aspartate--tRNA ligase [Chloroflexota bacterium]